MKHEEKKTTLTKLADRLYDPLQFRIFVTVVMLVIGYVGVYTPLGDRIAETAKEVKRAREHESLVHQIAGLQAEVDRIRTRLPKNTDTNEWIEYVLAGVRKLPVTLISLDSDDLRRVGPFEAVVLRVDLQGEYHALESFLNWIDTNERLFRVDSITVAPARGSTQLEMSVRLLGLRG